MLNLNLGLTQAIIEEADRHNLSVSKKAYLLATGYWETNGTMLPVREAYYLGEPKGENYRKKLRYYPWYGRGLVQLTWESNYLRAGREIGVDLIGDPDAAMDAASAVKILVIGSMQGWFSGKKLSDYFTASKCDYFNARRIINILDSAKEIAAIAAEYEAALTPAPDYPNIRIGSRGAAVSTAQGLLNAHGLDAGATDGIFGDRTRRAAVMFQKARGLTDDGVIGPKTWAKLQGEN